MKNSALKCTSVVLAVAILVSGCASSTVLSTTPSGADVYIQDQQLGKTPYTYSDRKVAGASTMVTFKKEGYEDYNTSIRKNKKLNVGALLSGLLLVYPLLWILGYDEDHSYVLEEELAVAEPAAVREPAKKAIAAPVAPEEDLPDYGDLPTSSRVESLLSQGQIDKAVQYADDQEGAFQAGCYYSIAHYYLDKGNYPAAEDFFRRSGKLNEGAARIAEAMRKGEVIDPAVVVDDKTAVSDSTGKALTAISNEKNPATEKTDMILSAEDTRVLITIDSIVRSSTQPQDLVKALQAGNSSLRSRPVRNADYVQVFFKRSGKKPLNLTTNKDFLANISLSDQTGKYYTIVLERGPTYIRTPGGGQILWNPEVPQPEGVIVDYSYMLFFMPVNSNPARLNYIYNYKVDKNDRRTTSTTLTINLLQ